MVVQSNIEKINIFLIIFCLLGLFLQTTSVSVSDFPDFVSYCQQFNKVYDNAQYGQRQQIYYQNIQYIILSNLTGLGVNMFTDISIEEMNSKLFYFILEMKGGFETNIPQHSISINDSAPILAAGLALTDKTPLSYDWRDYNAVTSIKYQQGCGGCWAFSTTAFFESDLIIGSNYTNKIDLSQQFLLKCDNRSLKCDGGFLFWAMNRVIDDTTGMPTQSQYPYNYPLLGIENGMCYETDLIKVDANKKQIAYFNIEDPVFIQKMILKKPVNVNLCSKDLQFYSPTSNSRTLFCTSNATRRDHTVLLIGYTETEWIIKNQWSTGWGVDGYGYISKNSDADCCIGKQLYTTGVVTQNCSVANCSVCVQETSCYQCNTGYYVVNQNSSHACAKCTQPYCQKCLNFYGLCDVCQDGYAVTYPYYNCQPSNVSHCSFMYSGNCAECHDGYVLNMNGQCVSEALLCYVKGCQQCKSYSPKICINCSAGYVLNTMTSLCDPIPACNVQNCSQCFANNANKCEVCSQQGYEFSETASKCVLKCPIQGCQSCALVNFNATTQCVQCQPGYNLSSDNSTCQKCKIQLCADCSKDINSCVFCLSGFYFNTTTQKCQSCSEVDKDCVQCGINSQSSQLVCTKCNNGFTVSENKTNCLRCLSDCTTCSFSSLSVCSNDCGPTNYFSQNICNSCPQNCQVCSVNNTCSTCLPGFVLQNGLCYKMCKQGSKCGNCQLGINDSVCLSCSGGYMMKNNSCVFDPTYACLSENGLNPPDCSLCPQKYYLNSSFPRKICSKCQTTDPNCVSCLSTSPSSCLKCANQYYLEKINQTCVQCSSFDSNCLTCSGVNLCKQCNPGYYVLSTSTNQQDSGICYPCNPSCATCKYSSEFCTSCQQGYELTVNNKCLNQVKIKFTILLDADYDSALNSFMMQIYNNLAELFGLSNSSEIEIINVVKGSISVSGYFHMPSNQNDPNAFLQNTKSILASHSQVGSYTILSSDVQLINDSSAFNGNKSDLSIGVLIGVAVGGGVFSIIVIIVLIWAIRKYGCKKTSPTSKQSAKGQQVDNNRKQVSQKSNNNTAKSTYPTQQKHTTYQNPIDESQKCINEPPANGPSSYLQYIKGMFI